LVVRPLAAALNLTISLPLAPTFVTTSLTPLVPWTQLLANIVGLSGVLSVVGVLFGAAEKRFVAKGKAHCAGAHGGDAAAEIAALQAALAAQHAETQRQYEQQQQQLAALAERVRALASRSGLLAAVRSRMACACLTPCGPDALPLAEAPAGAAAGEGGARDLSVKELKAALAARGVPVAGLAEKEDLRRALAAAREEAGEQ
jgi:uncharacterized coiled-coil protein SlyX